MRKLFDGVVAMLEVNGDFLFATIISPHFGDSEISFKKCAAFCPRRSFREQLNKKNSGGFLM